MAEGRRLLSQSESRAGALSFQDRAQFRRAPWWIHEQRARGNVEHNRAVGIGRISERAKALQPAGNREAGLGRRRQLGVEIQRSILADRVCVLQAQLRCAHQDFALETSDLLRQPLETHKEHARGVLRGSPKDASRGHMNRCRLQPFTAQIRQQIAGNTGQLSATPIEYQAPHHFRHGPRA